MEEFLAGKDGDDDESCEVEDVCTVPTGYQMPTDDTLREFIRSCQPVSQPEVQQPVQPEKQTGKGKRRK